MKRFLAVAIACVFTLAGCGATHHATPRKATAPVQSAMGSVHPPGWGAPVWGIPKRQLSASNSAEQFDTTTLSTIPTGAAYLAGYTAGRWITYGPLLALPWHPHVISIAISASFHAQCLDVEPGDAVPSQAAGWIRAVLADPGMRGSLIGGKPCVYSSLWEFLHQVIPDVSAAGIARSSFWSWDADYMFVSRIDPGFDCTQWTDRALGRNLDESTCSLAFLGTTPKPVPKPARIICFGKGALSTPGCRFVQNEVSAWRKQSASDLANAARVTRNWS